MAKAAIKSTIKIPIMVLPRFTPLERPNPARAKSNSQEQLPPVGVHRSEAQERRPENACSGVRSGFACDAFGETLDADDAALVDAAGNDFMFVARLDVESGGRAFG